MKRYEMIKELYDSCHGKSNSYVEEIETEDLDEYMKKYITKLSEYSKAELDDGSICYIIGMLKKIREQLGKTEGDEVEITVTQR